MGYKIIKIVKSTGDGDITLEEVKWLLKDEICKINFKLKEIFKLKFYIIFIHV